MGTKNQPGAYDCYAAAEPDEPMFVLLGRDPSAPLLILLWARIRKRMHEGKPGNEAKVAEARACAEACEQWARNMGKGERIERVSEMFVELSREGAELVK